MTPRRDQDTPQIFADFFSSMVSDSHTLSLQSVEGTDHLVVEHWADPHRVGIDQFLDRLGATVTASLGVNCRDSGIFQLSHQTMRVVIGEEVVGVVTFLPASRLVQVIEAVTASRVLTGNGVCIKFLASVFLEDHEWWKGFICYQQSY